MDKNYEELKIRIELLEKVILSLQNSSTIPYTIDKSFLGRGYLKTKTPPIFLNGLDQGSWLNNNISLSGAPETIMVTAFPTAFAQIKEGEFAGFWIPLYVPPRVIV